MLVFDLETDGLLNDLTKIHCLVIYDSDNDTTIVYNDQGNEEPIVRAYSMANHPAEGNIVMLNMETLTAWPHF